MTSTPDPLAAVDREKVFEAAKRYAESVSDGNFELAVTKRIELGEAMEAALADIRSLFGDHLSRRYTERHLEDRRRRDGRKP